MVEEVAEARVVVYGSVIKSDIDKQTSEIAIETIIKDDSDRPKGKTLIVSKFLDSEVLKDKRVLLFCDFYKGKIDAYRGIVAEKDSDLPKYVVGAWERRDKPMPDRLRYYFNYLDNPDDEASADAYKEFARSDYSDFKRMAKDLPSERVIGWLKGKPGNPAQTTRAGLYASMLGHCGKKEDAAIVRTLLDDADRRTTGSDGLLAAYVMLAPKDGFAYLRTVLNNPKEDFLYRYAALRALRFLHDYRLDLIEKKEIIAAACLLLEQRDIADMAIEDLRKWQCWDVADKVLAVTKRDWFDEETVVKRAVLRYCLQCEGNAVAKGYVEARKKEDAEAVKDALELLELEKPVVPPGTKTAIKR